MYMIERKRGRERGRIGKEETCSECNWRTKMSIVLVLVKIIWMAHARMTVVETHRIDYGVASQTVIFAPSFRWSHIFCRLHNRKKKNQQPLLFLSWLLSSEICVPWLQKRKAQFHPIKLFPGWYCWNPWGWKCGNARTACNPHPLFDGVICKSHSRSTLQAHRYRLSAKVTIMPVLVYMWSPTCLNLGSSDCLRLRVPLAAVR